MQKPNAQRIVEDRQANKQTNKQEKADRLG